MGDFQEIVIALMIALAAVGAVVVPSWFIYLGWIVPSALVYYGYRPEATWVFAGWIIGSVIAVRFGKAL